MSVKRQRGHGVKLVGLSTAFVTCDFDVDAGDINWSATLGPWDPSWTLQFQVVTVESSGVLNFRAAVTGPNLTGTITAVWEFGQHAVITVLLRDGHGELLYRQPPVTVFNT